MNTDVRQGDLILTSGLGARFPAGFPVGTVTTLRPDDSRAFLVGELKPAAQLDRGHDVLLLRSAPRYAWPSPQTDATVVAVGASTLGPPAGAADPQVPLTPVPGAQPAALAPAPASAEPEPEPEPGAPAVREPAP